MADMMTFPDTVEEFMEQYKMTDTKQVYSNGTEYVPIFRMEQWFEHEKVQLSRQGTTSDTISRQEALDALRKCQTYLYDARDPELKIELSSAEAAINNLPTIQPEPTYEQVEEYCKRRCLHVVTDDFFESTKPQRLGHWIKHTDSFDGEQYECSECGVLWEFNDGTPEENEAYFCPKCGAKMTTSK